MSEVHARSSLAPARGGDELTGGRVDRPHVGLRGRQRRINGPAPSLSQRALRLVGRIAVKLVVPACLIGVWWLVSGSETLARGLLPSPPEVVRALWEWVVGGGHSQYSGQWVSAALASTQRVLIGYVVGCALGLVVGVLVGYYSILGRMVEPTIHVLRAIPIIGWLPITFVLFGFGVTSSVLLIALGAFFPVVVSTISGVRGASSVLLRVGRMAGAGHVSMFRWIVVPSALPEMLSGLRISMGYAWVLVIIGEWEAVNTGLGHVLLDAYNFLRYDFVVAAMVSVGVMGFVFDRIVWACALPLTRWHRETSLGEG